MKYSENMCENSMKNYNPEKNHLKIYFYRYSYPSMYKSLALICKSIILLE